MYKTYLIIDKSEDNADLYYKTGFFIPDPCIYIEHKGKKLLILNDLELDRGKKDATVDHVLSYSYYSQKIMANKKKKVGFADIVDAVFREYKIKSAVVPGRFPLKYADILRKLGYKIAPKNSDPFFEERLTKNPEEIKHIRNSLKYTSRSMKLAIDIISNTNIKNNYLYHDGKLLTSEFIKGEINSFLSKSGYSVSNTIVASGVQGSMPHHPGNGPILANSPVVIDIFPRSQVTGYFGDMTRTVIRGKVSPELNKMYKKVLEGQKIGISKIKHGVKSSVIHNAIVNHFKNCGFKTGNFDGKQQGFIHSTGHGLGLEIHEPPRVGSNNEVLVEGNVVTVEPGLYYEKLGGIRIEDVVVVTKNGCKVLSSFPKKFEV